MRDGELEEDYEEIMSITKKKIYKNKPTYTEGKYIGKVTSFYLILFIVMQFIQKRHGLFTLHFS